MAYKFTVFCQDKSGTGTIWIDSVATDSFDCMEAVQAGREMCADAWECDPDDVHVLGVAVGDVDIAFWDDIED